MERRALVDCKKQASLLSKDKRFLAGLSPPFTARVGFYVKEQWKGQQLAASSRRLAEEHRPLWSREEAFRLVLLSRRPSSISRTGSFFPRGSLCPGRVEREEIGKGGAIFSLFASYLHLIQGKALQEAVAPGAKVDKWPSLLYIPPMPEVRLIPNRSRTLPFTGPLPQREHRKIALSVEGEAASLTSAAPKGMKVGFGPTASLKTLFMGGTV